MSVEIEKARNVRMEYPFHKLEEQICLENARCCVSVEDIMAELNHPSFTSLFLYGHAFIAKDTVSISLKGLTAIQGFLHLFAEYPPLRPGNG